MQTLTLALMGNLTEDNMEEEIIECYCDDPSCPQKGVEGGDVGGHIEKCICYECHHAIAKLR